MRTALAAIVIGWGGAALAGTQAAAQAAAQITAQTDAPPATPPPPATPATRSPTPRVPNPTPAVKQRIGYTAAVERLGDRMPSGSRVRLGLVEGNGPAYGPPPEAPMLRGLPLRYASGPVTAPGSGHALMTATRMTGRTGLVAEPRELVVWSVADWLGDGYLGVGTEQFPEAGGDQPAVFSHSWVGTGVGRAVPVLRRVDAVIDAYDVLMCVGVNNGADTPIPPMLASGYNSIAVGVSSGQSSGGGTVIENSGRLKPDLVVPVGTTSEATPLVAGAAALAVDLAERLAAEHPAPLPGEAVGDLNTAGIRRSETIKAALLAGTTKPKAWAPAADAASGLDPRLGAGQLHVDRTLRILERGHTPPGATLAARGYSFGSLDAGAAHDWTFTPGAAVADLTVVLVWHRRVRGEMVTVRRGDEPELRIWRGIPRVADFDLRLAGPAGLVAESVSDRDNVELIHVPRLEAGAYTLRVDRATPGVGGALAEPGDWDYAMAWYLGGLAGPADAE